MDRFSFFFGFYGLILGLAVTELLGGFARVVRWRALRKVEAQTALLALLVFVTICTTYIDAWTALRSIHLDFDELWAPMMLATFFYLAAGVVFPDDPAEFDRLAAYYADRKRFVLAMLFLAEALVNFTFLHRYETIYQLQPAVFWLWIVPWNLAFFAAFILLGLVRGRRANVALLVFAILMLLIPYWGTFGFRDAIAQHWGYAPID